MSEELFTRKQSAKDLLNNAEEKLSRGLFKEALEDLERVMEINIDYPTVYENIACVKFWLNREDKIAILKNDNMQLALFLDTAYKNFIVFSKRRAFDHLLMSTVAIHKYVYKKIIHLMTYKDLDGKKDAKSNLILLGKAFMELQNYTSAIKTFDYLNSVDPYNGECLFYLAEAYYRIDNQKLAKIYLRDALFYGSANNILDYPITMNWFYEIRSVIEKRGIHNSSEEEISSWMSAYGELMNILDVKRSFTESEEIQIRRNMSKLEAEHRKIKLRNEVSPKLLANYAWIMTSIVINKDEKDKEEVTIIGRKMALIDKELLQYYIKLLDLEE